MHRIPPFVRLRLTPLLRLALLALLLAGCGSAASNAALTGTPIPTPTRDPSGYSVAEPQACQVAEMATMQSNLPQGDLLAFRPNTQDLAYFAPTDRTSWYVGSLMLAKAPDYAERIPLAPSVLAAGDLTWSPDGQYLAFLAYRPNENLYTVMVVQADGAGLKDLFPGDAARTDARTSQKSIIKWKDDNTLEVMTSCGEECRNAYDVAVGQAAAPGLVPTTIADYRELAGSLKLHPNIPTYQPDQFPKVMPTIDPAKTVISQNWSPDNRLVAYLDKKGYLWMLSIQQKILYPLDIGLRDVYEMEWSSSSQTLGVRAEDQIFIFEVPCRTGK
jgi:hypothetical protein